MPLVFAKGRLDVVLIYHRISETDMLPIIAVFVIGYNFLLIYKGDLAVGNHRGEEQGVGLSAYRALDSDDFQDDFSRRSYDRSFIIRMDGQAGGVFAGTRKLVELNGEDDRIVKILRKLVVIIGLNCYHNIVLAD